MSRYMTEHEGGSRLANRWIRDTVRLDDDREPAPVPDFSFDQLQRLPPTDDPTLVAVDAADRLILDEAATDVQAAPTEVAVIGDRFGALTLGAAAMFGATSLRVHQDNLAGEAALRANAAATGLDGYFTSHALDADLVRGACVVLMQLPKSLPELHEIAETIARHADPAVVVFAGGRVKHMSTGMNDVLRARFDDVHATLGRQKSRVLVARSPKAGVQSTFPKREWHADLDLWVAAHGAAFGGTKVDLGTRYLLTFLERMNPTARDVVDLGCGTGVLAAAVARARPQVSVVATDDSAAAVASASATMRLNSLAERVLVVRDDAMSTVADASVDLVVCNSPFHVGTTVDPRAAVGLFGAAARVLRAGGELWTVFNRHLPYERDLEHLVGPTKLVGRSPKFTVAVSTRGPR